MTLNELNNADRLEFEKYFMQDEKAMKLDKEFHELQKKGKWVQSFVVRDKIVSLRESLFQKWIEKLNHSVEEIDLNRLDIPDEIKERMNILYVTVFMACDIVESCVLDMNDTLKKVDDSLCVDMFDGMLKLSQDAKNKLSRFQRNTGYLNDIYWGDKCDNMYEMMQNKAKKLIRHNKEKDGE